MLLKLDNYWFNHGLCGAPPTAISPCYVGAEMDCTFWNVLQCGNKVEVEVNK